jgi:hypothetical protein
MRENLCKKCVYGMYIEGTFVGRDILPVILEEKPEADEPWKTSLYGEPDEEEEDTNSDELKIIMSSCYFPCKTSDLTINNAFKPRELADVVVHECSLFLAKEEV